MPAAHLNIQGYNPSASTTAATVWAVGSGSYAQLTTGTALEVVSSSANDTAAGTGARTVLVRGVDASYVPFQETVTLNGVTPVALANTSVIAINAVVLLTAGSGLTNAGNIDVRTVSGSVIKSRISLNVEANSRARDFIYTIPASQTALLKRIQVYVTGSTGDIWVYLNSFNSTGMKQVRTEGSFSLDNTGFASGPFLMDFGTGIHLPEKTLIELRADVSAGTPVVNAIGELELYAS